MDVNGEDSLCSLNVSVHVAGNNFISKGFEINSRFRSQKNLRFSKAGYFLKVKSKEIQYQEMLGRIDLLCLPSEVYYS